jgi:hypothetical protein
LASGGEGAWLMCVSWEIVHSVYTLMKKRLHLLIPIGSILYIPKSLENGLVVLQDYVT